MNAPGSPDRADVRRAAGSVVVAAVSLAAVILAVLVVAVLAAPGVFSLVVSGVLGPRDGNAIARANIEQSVSARVDRLGYWYQPTDAETFAAERLMGDYGGAAYTPLRWSGRVAQDEIATIDVLLRSDVPAHAATLFGERSTRAGAAEGCYRFTVPSSDFVSAEAIECPAGITVDDAPTPTPTLTPALPDDATERIVAVLERRPRADPAAALRRIFPGPGITVETTTTDRGERVIAVGAPASGDCRLVVERSDGTIVEPGFDPSWILPGEVGCSTELFTAPPR